MQRRCLLGLARPDPRSQRLALKAVSLVQAWCADADLPVPGEDTGSYSRGRGRLPIAFLTAANTRINAHLTARIQLRDTYQATSSNPSTAAP